MVDKILSTSNSKSLLQRSWIYTKQPGRISFILTGFLSILTLIQCTPKLEWIRSLPSDFPRDQKITLGIYQRPSEKKSAYGSKGYELHWQEEIHLQSNSKFVKTWSEWKVYEDHSEFQFKEGVGSFEKSGDWVLLKTNSITEFECNSKEKVNAIARGRDWKKSFPCSATKSPNIQSKHHTLLYFYDGKSLFPLQYESGYMEANFGIAWESDLPYTKSILFEKAKLKYGKKEFQPHVYNHVKLD
ncbi:hypothetical protein [Leptospira kanakyensis]|uniref:hypothetical protein n=1 Tax=Leptospira kanakyensis TaxID=2484968 RepID=UPI00223E026F|nr:hypothetical protein [Leptospira kanakyensis]MCW7481147.1 hypothetical protein [Leptospira kanakyensis]